MVLAAARTGSTLLVQALNSHPRINCFREVFNGRLDFVDFTMEGYDNFSSRDLARRKADPTAFLHERVFCAWPEEIAAVGFKFIYGHHWDFPGLVEHLRNDRELRVVHLQRRNLLRMLVSERLAERTGIWLRDPSTPSGLSRANVIKALRHPGAAFRRMRRWRKTAAPTREGAAPKITVAPDELFGFQVSTNLRLQSYDTMFADHPSITLSYEDLVDRRDETLAGVQRFLGVEPQPLTVTLERQNPQPLRELIENYDELHDAYRHAAEAWMFD